MALFTGIFSLYLVKKLNGEIRRKLNYKFFGKDCVSLTRVASY